MNVLSRFVMAKIFYFDVNLTFRNGFNAAAINTLII